MFIHTHTLLNCIFLYFLVVYSVKLFYNQIKHFTEDRDMKEIQIVICDDQKYSVKSIEILLKKCEFLKDYQYQIYTFTSSISMFEFAKKTNIKFDIAFLDIELGKSTLGTDVGTQLKTINPDTLLIYVSGYDCYYKDLVKAEPFYFIDKPVDSEKLKQPMENAINRLLHLNQDYSYRFKFNGITFKTDLKDVICFESQHRIIQIHHAKGDNAQFYNKLDNVEAEIEKICPYFVRVNKSFYVNTNYISNISTTHICVDGIALKISPKYKKSISKKFNL